MILQAPFHGKLQALFQAGFRLVAPPCLLCRERATEDLCPACFRDLPWNDHACAQCAQPLPPLPSAICGACARKPPHFDAAYAAFHYAWPIDRLLHRFKFRGHLANGHTLALALGEYLDLRAAPRPDLILPVPLHHQRLAARGFNQAGEIARTLGRRLDVPVAHDAIRRIRATPAQRGLGRGARRSNLKGAFSCRRHFAGAHVAVVDDVITTASTANALAHVLKQAGAAKVSLYALARA
ncbi:MAG: double zinc ribbon domain-containing protein [Gammaproteobacteria bacterium]